MSWYETLPKQDRDALFAWMRKTNENADAELKRGRALEAPPGTIAIGAAAFDPFIRGESKMEYLRRLRRGDSPTDALKNAKAHARICVSKHNSRRPSQVDWQRYEGTADSGLEHLHRTLLRALPEGVTGCTVTEIQAERDAARYLDWLNNFLTVPAFAAYYQMGEAEAQSLINRERAKAWGTKGRPEGVTG